MEYFNWLDSITTLSNVALTVRAQAVPVNDNGILKWDRVMPRADVASVKLATITNVRWRPAAEFRNWDSPGRRIAQKSPEIADLEITPIEVVDTIGEREMQSLVERGLDPNTERFRQFIAADLPSRIDRHATAVYRRIEIATFQAIALGLVTVRDPVNPALTYNVSYGFDASRYTAAVTPWNDASVNAYDAFMSWIEDVAMDLVGPIEGVMLRRYHRDAILADAPLAAGGSKPTILEVEDRIRQTLGSEFTFVLNQDTVDVFTGGGQATAKTNVFPARIVAIPAGGNFGEVAFAPVVRSTALANVAPDMEIETNGLSAFREPINFGKGLQIEVQGNAMPVPDEQKIAVIDPGF